MILLYLKLLINLFFLLLIYRLIYFTASEFYEIEKSTENIFLASVQLTEIFYIFNFSNTFYLYCLTGTLFRRQLLK